MKKVIVNEDSYNRLLSESGYGNDDLPTLVDDLTVPLNDVYSILNEHFIMAGRMKQQPNPHLSKMMDAVREMVTEFQLLKQEIGTPQI
jgi:hypothetical protein